ncbi:MAG TPA: Uma2 family endonuclease, partial [Labilithrix sp.]
LAIEVIWTSGGLDKLEVYRELGVREVWLWESGAISVHVLQKGGYRRVAKSRLLPRLDLAAVATLATAEDQTAAVRTFRAALRAKRRG